MASPPFSKSAYHARSISLPSRPQQVDNQLHEQLCRLKSSQAASTSSSSSLSHRLTGLKDLYSSVVELLQMPSNQQSLSQIQQTKWVEELLDGSLRLLDICGTSRDVLLQSKERIQDMQSTLRRRSSGELDISNEIVKYLNTRKTAKKTFMKCLKHIKVAEKNAHSNAIECILKDVEEITVIIFKSLLSHIAGVKLQSQKNSWSVIAQLLLHSADKEGASPSSIFDTVDATLVSLITNIAAEISNIKLQPFQVSMNTRFLLLPLPSIKNDQVEEETQQIKKRITSLHLLYKRNQVGGFPFSFQSFLSFSLDQFIIQTSLNY